MHPCTAIFFEFLDQCTLAPPFFPVFGLIPTPDTPFYQDFSLPLATKLEQQKMRNLVELQEIERTFRFRYPELYRRLCADGTLYAGEFTETWYEDFYPEIRKNPPLLLFNCDFETFYAEDVEAELRQMADPDDYRHIPKEIRLIPFGQNGAGDLYCFRLDEKADEIPVVFAPHDEEDATYVARNLEDFIFTSLLEAAVSPYIPEGRDEQTEYEDLRAQFRSHRPYLTPRRQKVLEEYYRRKPFNYEAPATVGHGTEIRRGLLTTDEFAKTMKAEINYPKLYETFTYMG